MCVAILKTQGHRVSRKTLNDAWETNPHGGGLAWVDNGKINVWKSLDQKEFVNNAVKLQTKYLATNMLIHMRIKTHGFVSIANTHPFSISKDVVFIHNGIIPNMPQSEEISDTRFFNRLYLRKLPFKFKIGNKALRRMIEAMIGGSKLVFLNSNGEYDIANEPHGSWKGGNWFSNLYHCNHQYDEGEDWGGAIFKLRE